METKLHIIPTFHHDIAYLRPESWYRDRAFAILDRAVGLMEADETYTFTVEQAYFFRDYWEERPELREKLKTYASRGQLNFAPGFWVVPDMTMPGGESIYMQATLGQEALAETVGILPKAAFIADCWGHHAQLPQILSQCGYEYYVFARCMLPELDRENFRWQGLDGTEIGAHWLSTNYGGISFPGGEVSHAEEQKWEHASKNGLLSLMRRNEEKGSLGAQPIPAGGDMAMPALSASSIVRQLREDPEMPSLAFSSLEKALAEIDYSAEPVFCGEFVGSLKGTFAVNIELKQATRRTEALLYSLEALAALTGKELSFREDWSLLLKNQFHDILCGSLCNEALEQAFREFGCLADSLEKKRAELADGSDRLFNPLNFPVSGIVQKDESAMLAKAASFGIAEELPLTVEEVSLPADFENEWYRVTFDRSGYAAELWDRRTGKKLVDHPSVPFGSLQMQADNGDNWVEFEYPWEKDATAYVVNDPDPYDRRNLPTHPRAMLSGSNIREVRVQRLGDEGLRIIQRGSLNYWQTNLPFTVTTVFSKRSPRIEYHTELTNNSRRLRVRAAFPAAYAEGRIRHQIPYGLTERGEGPQSAQMFMDYETDGAGLALLNRGLPHNNTEGGIMMLTLLRSVAMEYKCDSDLSYGFGKTYAFDYAVCPHPADSDDLLWRQALSFGHPMIPVGKVSIPADFAVENAFLSALRLVEGGIFLRLYNGTDQPKEALLRLPAQFGRVSQTDGCMRPLDSREFDGELRVPLKPFEVRGLLFRR